MKTRVAISGFREAERKLERLARSLPAAVQERILTNAGVIVEDEAKILVPVLYGDLRESIGRADHTIDGKGKASGGVVAVYIGPSRGGNPSGFQAHFIEFGTIYITAQPFMRPAFDHTEGQVLAFIGAEARREIMQAVW